MSIILDLITPYWGIGAVVVVGGVYFATHRKVSIAYARGVASKAMLAAEKAAEDFVLNNGPEKFDWVVEKGYLLLPPLVKVFISKELFKTIVQILFDEAKDFAEKNKVGN